MKVPQIVRVPILPLRVVNAYLVLGEAGAVLIDAGLPGSEAAIGKALARVGRSFGDLTAIVITHAHVDHAGNAARLRELSGAPIVAHRGDLAHYRRAVPMTFHATGLSGRLFRRTGLMDEPFPPFTPDVLVEDEAVELAPWGAPGRIVPTVGHTAGSLSVVLPGGDAVVGDLVASGLFIGGIACLGNARRPPFEDDAPAVARALVDLLAAGVERFHLGHGGPLGGAAVRRHAERLAAARP